MARLNFQCFSHFVQGGSSLSLRWRNVSVIYQAEWVWVTRLHFTILKKRLIQFVLDSYVSSLLNSVASEADKYVLSLKRSGPTKRLHASRVTIQN